MLLQWFLPPKNRYRRDWGWFLWSIAWEVQISICAWEYALWIGRSTVTHFVLRTFRLKLQCRKQWEHFIRFQIQCSYSMEKEWENMNYLIWAVGACLLNHRRERILREKYIVIFDFVDRIDQAVKKLGISRLFNRSAIPVRIFSISYAQQWALIYFVRLMRSQNTNKMLYAYIPAWNSEMNSRLQ